MRLKEEADREDEERKTEIKIREKKRSFKRKKEWRELYNEIFQRMCL